MSFPETRSTTTSSNLQDPRKAPNSIIESLRPGVAGARCDGGSGLLCAGGAGSPLPLDLSLSDRASRDGAFIRANLHLHCRKLGP